MKLTTRRTDKNGVEITLTERPGVGAVGVINQGQMSHAHSLIHLTVDTVNELLEILDKRRDGIPALASKMKVKAIKDDHPRIVWAVDTSKKTVQFVGDDTQYKWDEVTYDV